MGSLQSGQVGALTFAVLCLEQTGILSLLYVVASLLHFGHFIKSPRAFRRALPKDPRSEGPYLLYLQIIFSIYNKSRLFF